MLVVEMLPPVLSAVPDSGTPNSAWSFSPQLVVQPPFAANLNWTPDALVSVTSQRQ